ncbi:MAG: PspC domain-containing protein [Actinomycetota bacterium]
MASGSLARSNTDRKLGGVAAGLAAHFDVDPTLVRMGFVVAGFMGWGILAYIVLWIVLPEAPSTTPAIRVAEERFARGEISAHELQRIREDLQRPA